jgi:hypothetical protein
MLTAKLKRKMQRRPYILRGENGQEIILAPIVGTDGRVHRFIVLDRGDPLPIPHEETETYLRVE